MSASSAVLRGISLKLQEEERERRMDFVPDSPPSRSRPSRLTVTPWTC